MDYETLKTCFVAVFIDYKKDTQKIFVINSFKNDYISFIEFLKENINFKEYHISFNGLSFDSQITQFIIKNNKRFEKLSGKEIAIEIYNKAQETIRRSNNNEFQEYPEWKLSIGQIDVFKINHWDNANKRTSLKWAQFATDWYNIQEMPIHHNTDITTQEELDIIINYCINDVLSTKKILFLSKPLIDVRNKIKSKYGLNCYNYSNTKLGSELLLKLYCDITGKDSKDVKQYRTKRDCIPIKDVLFPYIKFQSIELQTFHEMLKSKVIYNTKDDFKYTLSFKGYDFYYGAGGIHQCIDTGVYKENDKFIIKDLDVASLYPSIACMNNMYPAHLGEEFFKVYKNDIVDVRLKEKSKKENKDMAIIEGFKEAANASYGNSNSPYSWLYDSFYTMQTTINGQLLLTMLVEDLLLHLTDCKLLQTNTDGATFMIKKSEIDIYNNICKKWEELTKLTLEFADYKAMYIWDVNNYFSIYTNGKAKCKGRFEWEDLQNYKYTHLHKNKSHLIVSKAIFNYFVNDIPPEQYLQDNRNIFDYCAGVKIKGDWQFEQTCLKNQEVTKQVLQKTIRYYISNNGCKIIKVHKSDGREIQLESGKWLQTDLSYYEKKEWADYNVNDEYYLEQIYKEIHGICPPQKTQLSLF